MNFCALWSDDLVIETGFNAPTWARNRDKLCEYLSRGTEFRVICEFLNLNNLLALPAVQMSNGPLLVFLLMPDVWPQFDQF